MNELAITWYGLIGLIFAAYAVLDGFDLGAGTVHLLTRSDRERRVVLNALGPVWDGNEVWLVIGGGVLFAAFPMVYASVMSGFYLAVMLLLLGLIFRAAAMDFRSRRPSRWWRQTWDVSFSAASVAVSLLLGIALGNVIRGIPIDASGNYRGTFTDLLNPYALLTGATTLALFTMHGAVYLALRTDGDLRQSATRWARRSLGVFLFLAATLSLLTFRTLPHTAEVLQRRPWIVVVPVVLLAALAVMLHYLRHGRTWRAFLASSAVVIGMVALAGLTMYPVLVFATDPALNLTIFNASSTEKSLQIMLIIAVIGLPLALAYMVLLHREFHGIVKLDERGY